MEKYLSISNNSFYELMEFLNREFDQDLREKIGSPQELLELFESHLREKKSLDLLFTMAKLVTPNALGILGYIMLHSRTIEEAIKKLSLYQQILGKGVLITFVEKKEKIHLEIKGSGSRGIIMELIHVISIYSLIESVSKKTSLLHSISIKEEAKHFSKDLENRFRCGVNIGEDFSLNFLKISLDKNIPLDNPYILNIFEEEAKKILAISAEKTFADLVAKKILLLLSSLELSKVNVAKSLGVHSRTMQEKLQKEQTTYLDVLIDVRKKLAIYYLKKGLDVETIAISLGYSSSSGFLRGFKSWFGFSVKEWKKKSEAN